MNHTRTLVAALTVVAFVALVDPAAAQTAASPALELSSIPLEPCPIECTGTGPTYPGSPV